eukprot:425474_1
MATEDLKTTELVIIDPSTQNNVENNHEIKDQEIDEFNDMLVNYNDEILNNNDNIDIKEEQEEKKYSEIKDQPTKPTTKKYYCICKKELLGYNLNNIKAATPSSTTVGATQQLRNGLGNLFTFNDNYNEKKMTDSLEMDKLTSASPTAVTTTPNTPAFKPVKSNMSTEFKLLQLEKQQYEYEQKHFGFAKMFTMNSSHLKPDSKTEIRCDSCRIKINNKTAHYSCEDYYISNFVLHNNQKECHIIYCQDCFHEISNIYYDYTNNNMNDINNFGYISHEKNKLKKKEEKIFTDEGFSI